MNFIIYIAIIIALIIIIMLYNNKTPQPTVKMIATYDRQYILADGYDNTKEALDLLNHANERMFFLLCKLRTKYEITGIKNIKYSSSINKQERKTIKALLRNYNPEVFQENNPKYNNQTSWTISKGEAMHICLRSRSNNNELVDLNTLMFVILHESSHIANYRTYGHDNLFWRTFKFILQNAVEYNIYKKENYRSYPVVYCGVEINYQPLNDETLLPL